MSDESKALRADELIQELKHSGLFEKYDYQEVMSACLFMASRSLHRILKLPALGCLTIVEGVVKTMHQHEYQTGQLQAMLDEEQAPS